MDAQNLEFESEEFDLIVTRNLTWVLEDPEKAYKEWYRVLKNGGKLLNFDANWYCHLSDEAKKREYDITREDLKRNGVYDYFLDGEGIDNDWMEDIARQIPMSRTMRPAWDVQVLRDRLGNEVEADEKVWERVWDSTEKANYGSTPMFLVSAVKMGGTKAVCPNKEGYTS